MPFHASVAASKGAIEGLTRSLAAEFAPKIRVNCIAPSLTNTPMASRLLSSPEKIEASALRHPLKKIGDPKDLANMTIFLLSDASKWMTGQILHLDGGMSSVK
jgi:short-subunit dehydrogenase